MFSHVTFSLNSLKVMVYKRPIRVIHNLYIHWVLNTNVNNCIILNRCCKSLVINTHTLFPLIRLWVIFCQVQERRCTIRSLTSCPGAGWKSRNTHKHNNPPRAQVKLGRYHPFVVTINMGKLQEFEITLNNNKVVYSPGESISGTLKIKLAQELQCKGKTF